MAPLNAVDGQVVLCAQPSNVDTVFIDGEIRKRDGELVGIDRREMVTHVNETVNRLKQRVGVSLA
jgi:hypothetical protein